MEKIFTSIEKVAEELFTLESIIKVTKDTCQEREFAGIYYNLEVNAKTNLSKERNHYNNLLNIALDKITNLQEINLNIELELGKLKQNTNYSCRKITA